jgi:predicted metal-binding protein
MSDRTIVEEILAEREYGDFAWIEPSEIITAQWVRMKCEFGCHHYGTCAVCPPNVPSLADCVRFFSEYSQALLLKFSGTVEKPEDRHDWTRKINGGLLNLERAVFLAGYHKAFVLFVDPCNFCEACVPTKNDSEHPKNARPSPEGLGVDVFATARKAGKPIVVLEDYDREMNRYAILLVD